MTWSPRLCFPPRPGPTLSVLPGMCLLNVHLGISNNTDTTESLESWFCHQLNLPLVSFLVSKPNLSCPKSSTPGLFSLLQEAACPLSLCYICECSRPAVCPVAGSSASATHFTSDLWFLVIIHPVIGTLSSAALPFPAKPMAILGKASPVR